MTAKVAPETPSETQIPRASGKFKYNYKRISFVLCVFVVCSILIYLYYYYRFPKDIRVIHNKGKTTFINEEMFKKELSDEYNAIWYYIDGKDNKIISIGDKLDLTTDIMYLCLVVYIGFLVIVATGYYAFTRPLK